MAPPLAITSAPRTSPGELEPAVTEAATCVSIGEDITDKVTAATKAAVAAGTVKEVVVVVLAFVTCSCLFSHWDPEAAGEKLDSFSISVVVMA